MMIYGRIERGGVFFLQEEGQDDDIRSAPGSTQRTGRFEPTLHDVWTPSP